MSALSVIRAIIAFARQVLTLLMPLSAPLILMVAFINSDTAAEAMIVLLLGFALAFYYAGPVQLLLLRSVPDFTILHGLADLVAKALAQYQEFILDHLPRSQGISVLGKDILQFTVDTQFNPSPWPFWVLVAGATIRVFVGRFIPHRKLQKVTREYWLFLTAYIVLSLMVSTITHCNFLAMMLVLLITVFILATGVIKLGADFIKALWALVRLVYRAGKIATMYITIFAARVAKVLRKLVRTIREAYERYVIQPLRRLYKAMQTFLDQAESLAAEVLAKERLNDLHDSEVVEEGLEISADEGKKA